MSPSILVARTENGSADITRSALLQTLSLEGFEAVAASSLTQVQHLLEEGGPPDLLLLDRHLPDGDGLELVRSLRGDARTRTLPILMTARDQGVQVRIASLEAGADDFLPRPCSGRELLLRIRAVLRRSRKGPDTRRSLQAGPLRIDLQTSTAWWKEQALNLSPLDFRLLAAMARQPERVFTREQLLREVWEETHEVTERVVDVRIMLLRRKLPGGDDLIATVRGVGYRLAT